MLRRRTFLQMMAASAAALFVRPKLPMMEEPSAGPSAGPSTEAGLSVPMGVPVTVGIDPHHTYGGPLPGMESGRVWMPVVQR